MAGIRQGRTIVDIVSDGLFVVRAAVAAVGALRYAMWQDELEAFHARPGAVVVVGLVSLTQLANFAVASSTRTPGSTCKVCGQTVTLITTFAMRTLQHGRMSKVRGYTIEMLEFVGGKPAQFGPSFGVFTLLVAAEKAAALRIALGAPRSCPVGYRIVDQDRREVRFWRAGSQP